MSKTQPEAEADDSDVLLVNRSRKIAVLTCNCQVPVMHWFDAMGQDCDSEDATVCVCGDETHGWFTVDLLEFDYVTVH